MNKDEFVLFPSSVGLTSYMNKSSTKVISILLTYLTFLERQQQWQNILINPFLLLFITMYTFKY
jgi:hypothetical protein